MRFAVKRLTRSDLTFWEYQFRRQGAGNQKSINLNADVFIDVIFPQARTESGGHARQFPVPLTIYGPGRRLEPYRITRKIIAAGDRQKNWRLNGEFVRDPDFDSTRYHGLAAGDLALFGFEGASIPSGVVLVLLSSSEADDSAVFSALEALLGNRRMMEVDAVSLGTVVDQAPQDHPIRELLDIELDEALEDAALGSAEGVRRLRLRPTTSRMSPEALASARARAESIGRDGEIIMNSWLQAEVTAGRLKSAEWIAEANAVNPWDFEIEENDGTRVRIEVKSTSGPFERPFHISHAELQAAVAATVRTDLYRVFAVSDDGAWLSVTPNIKHISSDIIKKVESLGPGIIPDSYSVDPLCISGWSKPAKIENAAADDE